MWRLCLGDGECRTLCPYRQVVWLSIDTCRVYKVSYSAEWPRRLVGTECRLGIYKARVGKSILNVDEASTRHVTMYVQVYGFVVAICGNRILIIKRNIQDL